MIRPEEILEYVVVYGSGNGDMGVSANSIAEHFGLWRSEADTALGALVAQGKLVKVGNRPARYLPADKVGTRKTGRQDEHPPFSNMIGYNGSLKFQTQMAGAAVAYPPHGIHTLIIGETGVGKSMLASEMAHYLRLIRSSDTVPFVMFNCAEYADNPQLLLSQLFGYVKGAFTGADRDKEGLIEKADGGILFLDEIHRLPPTGQEMLFTVVDRGVYRRLGDAADRTAQFMIIGATTENPSNVLLNTFKRRMPLTIQIPLLCERPINERLDIICLFFYNEARRLGFPIQISYLALKLLVSFRGENNIGDLKNEVQIACARGYLEREQEKVNTSVKQRLSIDIYHLSRNLSINYVPDGRVDRYFSSMGLENGVEILPDRRPDFSPDSNSSFGSKFAHFLESQALALQTMENNPQEAERLMVSNLAKHSANSTDQAGGSAAEILYGSIAPAVWMTTNELIRYASIEFGRTYSQNTVTSVAYYLQQLKAYANAGRIIFSPTNFEDICSFQREASFVRKMLPLLQSQMNLELMDGEVVLLAMLLAQESPGSIKPEKNLIIVGYGTVASGAASFANDLLNTNFIKAFDIASDTDIDTMFFRLTGFFEKNPTDTLILSGLGTSAVLERALSRIPALQYCIIPALDPMLALECGRMILTTHSDLRELVLDLNANCQTYFGITLDARFSSRQIAVPPALKQAETTDMRDVIITYCITGTGSARIVREFLLRNLSVSSAADIMALGIMDDIFSVAQKLGKRLKLIIGITRPDIPGVPFVSMEQIFYSNSPDELLRINGMNLPSESDLEALEISHMPLNIRLMHCKEHLDYFSPSLDHQKVDGAVRDIIRQIGDMYKTSLSSDLVVRIYIHCATMLERIATADPVPMPLDGYIAMEHNLEWFRTLKKILNTSCSALRLTIADSEVYYLMMTLPAATRL